MGLVIGPLATLSMLLSGVISYYLLNNFIAKTLLILSLSAGLYIVYSFREQKH